MADGSPAVWSSAASFGSQIFFGLWTLEPFVSPDLGFIPALVRNRGFEVILCLLESKKQSSCLLPFHRLGVMMGKDNIFFELRSNALSREDKKKPF